MATQTRSHRSLHCVSSRISHRVVRLDAAGAATLTCGPLSSILGNDCTGPLVDRGTDGDCLPRPWFWQAFGRRPEENSPGVVGRIDGVCHGFSVVLAHWPAIHSQTAAAVLACDHRGSRMGHDRIRAVLSMDIAPGMDGGAWLRRRLWCDAR